MYDACTFDRLIPEKKLCAIYKYQVDIRHFVNTIARVAKSFTRIRSRGHVHHPPIAGLHLNEYIIICSYIFGHSLDAGCTFVYSARAMFGIR